MKAEQKLKLQSILLPYQRRMLSAMLRHDDAPARAIEQLALAVSGRTEWTFAESEAVLAPLRSSAEKVGEWLDTLWLQS